MHALQSILHNFIHVHVLTITCSTPSRSTPYAKALGPAESKVARALLGGHAPSIAKAVLEQEDIKNAVIHQLLVKLNDECTNLCRKSVISPFLLTKWRASSGRLW